MSPLKSCTESTDRVKKIDLGILTGFIDIAQMKFVVNLKIYFYPALAHSAGQKEERRFGKEKLRSLFAECQ